MTERGMIFNAEMVRAVLDGSKTQTRRIIKNQRVGDNWSVQPAKNPRIPGHTHDWWLPTATKPYSALPRCPYGAVGDRLWVRETFGFEIRSVGGSPHEQLVYRASKPDAVRLFDCNGKPHPMKWTPSLHMRRKYSRITLEITGVRVERLNDISEDDAKAEGAPTECCVIGDKHFLGFRSLWRSIYGADSWQANPWVWVIEFKRVEDGSDE